MQKIIMIFILASTSLHAAKNLGAFLEKRVNYKTYFGSCPSKVAGDLTLVLMKEFEKKKSLLSVKEKIINDNLADKYFLSDYRVNFDPIENKLKFHFDCPKILMKVQIYKNNGDQFYSAILVENGKLFDPNYENLLRSEGLLKGNLANLVLPVGALENDEYLEITYLLKNLNKEIRSSIAEVIVEKGKELTMLLSIKGKTVSVFFGNDYLAEKTKKLSKLVKYMKDKKKIPSVVNLRNSKKIVVKFSDSI